MVLAALLVGLGTAYFLGLRIGAYAAGITAVALVVALVVPAWRWTIYGALALYTVGLVLIGPRFAKPSHSKELATAGRRAILWVLSRLRQVGR